MAGAWTASGHRDVDALALGAGILDEGFQVLFGLVQRLDQLRFAGLHELTKRGAVFRRNAADQLLGRRESALFAEVTCAEIRQRTLVGDGCFQIEGRERRWIASKVRKAFELLLERFDR